VAREKELAIIAGDYAKNHRGREYSLESVKDTFLEYVKQGMKYLLTKNTIILYSENRDKTVEFHAINAGNKQDLVTAVNNLLAKAKVKFDKAVTYYDNPAINDLANLGIVRGTVKKIDGGLDRTYEMSFDLRG
jgi:hypothetical protein